MSNRRFLLDGTTAVLIVNGYRWTCPECRLENYTNSSQLAVCCPTCSLHFHVSEVRHSSGLEALLPGTHPGKLFKPELSRFSVLGDKEQSVPGHTAQADVALLAGGYSWRCPECDAVNFSPGVSFENVGCDICRSVYEVSEIRHRTGSGDLGIHVHPGAKWLTEERIDKQDHSSEGPMPSETNTSFIG